MNTTTSRGWYRDAIEIVSCSAKKSSGTTHGRMPEASVQSRRATALRVTSHIFERYVNFFFFLVSAPECWDIETALYDSPSVRPSVRTYVFSELNSIFQYVIKLWLRAQQLSGSGEHKMIVVAYEYTYQDHEYIIRTMNTKHELFGMAFLSCTQDCSQLY